MRVLTKFNESSAIETATATIHDRLDDLQFRRSFEDTKFVVLDQDGFGFGAQLHRRVLGLQFAYMFDRTVVFVNEHNPPYAPCLEPTGQYTYNDIKDLPQEKLKYTKEQQAKVAFFDFDSFWKDINLTKKISEWVPQEIEKHAKEITPIQDNRHWQDPTIYKISPARRYLEGQLLSRFKYLPGYKAAIEDVKHKIGFTNPIIGVHIRRGDKSSEEPYVPLRRYHAEIVRAVSETGIKRVFVTSDDPGVFADLPKQDKIEYLYDKEEPRYNNANHILIRDTPELARQETLTALKIYDILSYCDVLIGQNNAHLTLLAAARNSARTMGTGEYRLTRGDYCARFRHASPLDWLDVVVYKMRMFRKSTKYRQIRRVIGPLKRLIRRA